jgi:hypothetical protein
MDMDQLIRLLPQAMPEGNCENTAPEIRFIQAGCELLLKEALDVESTDFCFSETEPGVWYCYFWYWETSTGRLRVSKDGITVQMTVDDWDTSSSEYAVNDLADLRFNVQECAYDEAVAEHFG